MGSGNSKGRIPMEEVKDSVKDVYGTVSQRASDGKEILKDTISDKAEVFKEISDKAEIWRESVTGTAENLQESWILLNQYLRLRKYVENTVTREKVMVLFLVLGGTCLCVALLKWYRRRDTLSRKRKQKQEQRLQAIAQLTKKLETLEVS